MSIRLRKCAALLADSLAKQSRSGSANTISTVFAIAIFLGQGVLIATCIALYAKKEYAVATLVIALGILPTYGLVRIAGNAENAQRIALLATLRTTCDHLLIGSLGYMYLKVRRRHT